MSKKLLLAFILTLSLAITSLTYLFPYTTNSVTEPSGLSCSLCETANKIISRGFPLYIYEIKESYPGGDIDYPGPSHTPPAQFITKTTNFNYLYIIVDWLIYFIVLCIIVRLLPFYKNINSRVKFGQR